MVNFTYSPSTPSLTMKTKAKYKVRNRNVYDTQCKAWYYSKDSGRGVVDSGDISAGTSLS